VTQAPEEGLPSLPEDLLPGPDTGVLLFNHEESPDDVIRRLIGDSDMALLVDCADKRVTFSVMGWFVIPDRGVWTTVADGAA